MKTTEVLAIVKARGLDVVLQDGRPVLKRNGTTDAVTDKLLTVLKCHRDRIIDLLSRKEQPHE